MAFKAFKFRMYPNKEQQVFFAKTFGCVRFVYNYYLEKRIKVYQENKSQFSCFDCFRDLTNLKKKDECFFLKDTDSNALKYALRNLDSAYKKFFKDVKDSKCCTKDKSNYGFPHFKSKKSHKSSYTTNRNSQRKNVDLVNGYIKLPKVGLVKIKQHRQVPSNYKLKSATVSQTPSGKYYVSVLFEYENQVQQVEPANFIGMDYSMHKLYVDSNGNEPNYPRYYRKAESQLKREQRKLSLMQKGSNNRNKQRIKVAKLHERVANQRKDFLHKQSRQIANAYDCVCVEDLNMQSMSKSLHFGKSVSDNGWGMFTTFLKYKLEEQGKQLIKVDKYFPSSQLCHVCGYKNSLIKNLNIKSWTCPMCGTHHSRDINAAINIRDNVMRTLCA